MVTTGDTSWRVKVLEINMQDIMSHYSELTDAAVTML